ncbi:receptor-transporting protein 3-like [Vombatus ursinus]|uniref:receptor-transporting protein 3-like n=1 Tax=Vombatus ursinus TaxID=29139 RepID=UPI000FFD68EE|nr:receptor-transporting protein 3-like [Vombatus ursinus]
MTKNRDLWEQTFQQVIREKKPQHRQTLEVDSDLEVKSVQWGWRQYKHKSLARSVGSHGQGPLGPLWVLPVGALSGTEWVSALLVWKQLGLDPGADSLPCLQEPYGQVEMRVFAQRCQKCSTALFEEPEFSQEGIERVLGCLVVWILLRCYRESVPLGATREDPFRAALPSGPRDTENCEAC